MLHNLTNLTKSFTMESNINSTDRVYLSGPRKNVKYPSLPGFYEVMVATNCTLNEPKEYYRIYEKDRAIRLAHQIKQDDNLPLLSSIK